MSPRVYVRRFDWDEARARRAAGESYPSIARALGVSETAIQRVCKPEMNARMAAGVREWQRGGVCSDCGKRCSRNRSRVRAGLPQRCSACHGISMQTTIRPDTLRCGTCKEWKPDDAFPGNRTLPARRGRGRHCTACQTKARRDYRHRHAEQERAYARGYKRRRRTAMQTATAA